MASTASSYPSSTLSDSIMSSQDLEDALDDDIDEDEEAEAEAQAADGHNPVTQLTSAI